MVDERFKLHEQPWSSWIVSWLFFSFSNIIALIPALNMKENRRFPRSVKYDCWRRKLSSPLQLCCADAAFLKRPVGPRMAKRGQTEKEMRAGQDASTGNWDTKQWTSLRVGFHGQLPHRIRTFFSGEVHFVTSLLNPSAKLLLLRVWASFFLSRNPLYLLLIQCLGRQSVRTWKDQGDKRVNDHYRLNCTGIPRPLIWLLLMNCAKDVQALSIFSARWMKALEPEVQLVINHGTVFVMSVINTAHPL